MTALSIMVPDDLALDSLLIAKQLHISRAQFIRSAIEHEIKAYRLKKDQEKMASSFKALKKHPEYLVEIADVARMDTSLIDEGESWWKK